MHYAASSHFGADETTTIKFGNCFISPVFFAPRFPLDVINVSPTPLRTSLRLRVATLGEASVPLHNQQLAPIFRPEVYISSHALLIPYLVSRREKKCQRLHNN